MAAKYPHPAATGQRGSLMKQTPHSLQEPRRHWEACKTPLYIRKFHYYRLFRGNLAMWRALVEMSRFAGGVT